MEQVYENIEKEDIDMIPTCSPNMVEPIVNKKIGNTFHHHYVTNQRYHTQKKTGYQH